MNYKIAFSGASGAGKTTLLTLVKEKLNLKHISGSAGDIKKESDKLYIDEMYDYPGGSHHGVIAFSALNAEYGINNQRILLQRRKEMIMSNDNFITDRSPADNLTYFINQCAFHPMVTDEMVKLHAEECLQAWDELSHVIYIKSVQPIAVENNGNRIANRWYQKSIDAQFNHWITTYLIPNSIDGPKVLVIDYWDLEKRKQNVLEFIQS